MTLADLIVVIPSLIAAIAAVAVVYRQTRKDKSDIANAVGDAWIKLVKPLEERVAALETENRRLRWENTQLWRYIDDLRGLLRQNNIEAPELPEMDKEKTVPRKT